MRKEIGEENIEENSEGEKRGPGTVRAKVGKSRQHAVGTEKITCTSLPCRITGNKAK